MLGCLQKSDFSFLLLTRDDLQTVDICSFSLQKKKIQMKVAD